MASRHSSNVTVISTEGEDSPGPPTLPAIRDVDVWNLDNFFAHMIAGYLRQFREVCNHGYPSGMTEETWNADLDEMIAGFESHAAANCAPFKTDEEALSRSLELFANHFRSLWD